MSKYQFLDDVYDILAQNDNWATDTVKDSVTAQIDHVDHDNGYILFRNSKGKEFMLKLVDVYAPAPVGSK